MSGRGGDRASPPGGGPQPQRRPSRLLRAGAAVVALLAIVFVAASRGIPFVGASEQWSIGLFAGASPFDLSDLPDARNPILTRFDVTDVPARFVADPFLFRDGDRWLLFFEVYNRDTDQGDLAVATGDGGHQWDYGQVILDEDFHLSYPYVFEWEGERYIIPETFETHSIRLYRATRFPTEWSFVETLVEGRDYVDPSVAHFEGMWWMFAATTSNDTLHLFYAEQLEGPWQEHPRSPIVEGDLHRARPSGRVLVRDGRMYRFTMDVDPPRGTHRVFAYEITVLTTDAFAERPVSAEPVVEGHGLGWTARGMHQVDAHPLPDGRWIAAVDGFGPHFVLGLRY